MSLFVNDHFDFNDSNFHVFNERAPFIDSPQDAKCYFPTKNLVKTMSYSKNTSNNGQDYDGRFKRTNQQLSSGFEKKPVPNLESLFTTNIIRNIGSIKKNGITQVRHRQPIPTGALTMKVVQSPKKLNSVSKMPLTDCTNQNCVYSSTSTGFKRKISDVFYLQNSDLTNTFDNDVFKTQSIHEMMDDSFDTIRRIYSEPIIYDSSSTHPTNNKFLQYSSNTCMGHLYRPHSLPVITSDKEGLIFITSNTLSDLLEDRTALSKKDVMIVDCRYPYEYTGGHINGSINIYTKESLLNYFIGNQETPDIKSVNAIIFHCEYSKQRAPLLARFLRNKDRDCNLTQYPKLFYPEVYVLFGGYKEFYQSYPNLCCPSSYIKMADSRYTLDYAKYRRESKSSLKENSRFY